MPYQRTACLGSGFFGEVWLEADAALNRRCAAKYLDVSRLPAGLIFNEAQAMLNAEHDNVVRIYSADLEAGVPVIRMEYLPDGSIADRYGGRPTSVATALHAVEEACRGVEALHARGILHRDLKPGNLLMGAGGRIKVSDFGLACSVTNVAGAPPWGYTEHLPPEALGGSGGIDSVVGDIYALGVTLYRLLNGDHMMRSIAQPGRSVLDLVAAGRYPNRKQWQLHIHDRLRKVARKAMHVDPQRRYDSASQLRHALETARPVMSWEPVTIVGPGVAWEAISTDGSVHCRARLSPNRHGQQVFEIERQGPGGHFRMSRSDCLTRNTVKEVLPHAASVLQRVATEGR